MRSHGIYTTPGPHRPSMPRGFLPFLALLALAIGAAGLAVIVARRGPAVPQAQTPSVVPALVSRPIARPVLPDTKAICARSRIFADEVLGAQQASLVDRGALSVVVPVQPVLYSLPKTIPPLWLANRRYADEALGALRVPAPASVSMGNARFAVTELVPNTRAIYAHNHRFADEVLNSMSYEFAASAAMFGWSNEVTPRTGPR